MFVKQLPHDVHSMLCASMKINSYKTAVEELIYNSLDANSTSIAIRIHIKENLIQVIDNGRGIKKIDMNLVGQRYMTSKFINLSALKSIPDNYGLRGESLANIIEVSQFVSITSRYENKEDTWVKVFNESKGPKLNQTTTRPSKGTTVSIKGFLYNRGIQKKAVNEFNELQEIKTFLEHISLLHSNVSLSLRDDAKNLILLQLHKKRDIYQTLLSIYNLKKCDFKELKVDKHQYKVIAYIGTISKDIRKDCIFLNRKLVYTGSHLHNVVNDNLIRNLKSRNKVMKTKANGNDSENSILDKFFPFYFMFIECPYIDYVINQNSLEFKSWNQITKLLEKLVKFYIGDIDLKEVKTTTLEQHFNTREQVKEILTKILGNNLKKVEGLQIQKSVRGKISKRKRKKKNKPIKLSLPNIKKQIITTTTTGNEYIKNINIQNTHTNILHFKASRTPDNNVICQTTIHKDYDILHPNSDKETNINNETTKKDAELKNNVPQIMNSYNIKKRIITNNQKKSIPCCSNINIKHKNTAPSAEHIKENCDVIPRKVKKILDSNHTNEKTTIQKTIQHEDTTRKHQDDLYKKFYGSCSQNITKELKRDKINFNQELRYHQDISILFTPMKTTYDLIKTVMVNNCENVLQDNINKNRGKIEINHMDNENTQMISTVTFESHQYDNHEFNQSKISYNGNQQEPFARNVSKVNYHVLNSTCEQKEVVSKIKSTAYNMHFNNTNNIYKNRNDITINHSILSNIQNISYITEFPKNNQNNYYRKNNFVGEVQNKTILYSNNVSTNIKKVICETINIQAAEGDSKNNKSNEPPNQNKSKKFVYNSEELISSLHYKHSQPDDKSAKENLQKINYKEKFPISKKQDVIIEPINICETKSGSEYIFESEITGNVNLGNNNCDILQNDNINISRYFTNIDNSAKIDDMNKINYNLCIIRNDTLRFNINRNQQITDPVQDNLNKYQLSNKDCHENVIVPDFRNFSLKNRLRFVPKGMSPIFFNCNTKYACDYYLDKDYYEKTFYNNFINEVRMNSAIFNPLLQNIKDIDGRVNEKLQVEMHKDNAALKFDDRSLREAKILGQVDEKFIASVIKSKNNQDTLKFLVLFDQHAVHERIRTEKNLSDYTENNQWRSVKVEEINLMLSVDEIVYLHNYKDKFDDLGLEFTILNSEEITINAVPKAILGKNLREIDKVVKAVRNVILEEINIIKKQSGCISFYPKSIMDLVFSEACRYAIKFGDKLTKNDCIQLIKDLSDCKTPFQCAHGRPVLAVIMDIKSDEQEYKVDFTKLKEFKTKSALNKKSYKLK